MGSTKEIEHPISFDQIGKCSDDRNRKRGAKVDAFSVPNAGRPSRAPLMTIPPPRVAWPKSVRSFPPGSAVRHHPPIVFCGMPGGFGKAARPQARSHR